MTAKTRNYRRRKKTNSQSGFSLLQTLIVLGVVSVVTGLAFVGISSARQRIRLTNSSRLLASYVEKAHKFVLKNYTLKEVVGRFEAIYANLLTESHG